MTPEQADSDRAQEPAQTGRETAQPGRTPRAEAELAARRAREAAALRENLRRRKLQSRPE